MENQTYQGMPGVFNVVEPFAWPASLKILSAVMISMWFYNMLLKCSSWSWIQLQSKLCKRVFPFSLHLFHSADLAQPKEPPDSMSASESERALDSLCASLCDCNGEIRQGNLIVDSPGCSFYNTSHGSSCFKTKASSPSKIKTSSKAIKRQSRQHECPTHKLRRKLRRKQGRSRYKKLLLATFSLFSKMGNASASPFQLTSESLDRDSLRKYRACTGMLKTNDLNPRLLAQLHSTLSLNAESFYHEAHELASDAIYAVVDTGCSKSCSPFKEDFIPGTMRKLPHPTSLGGIAGDLKVEYEGDLCWETLNDKGDIIQFRSTGYLVPGLPSRLFSPQSFLSDSQRLEDHFRVWHDRTEWWMGNQKVMTMAYDSLTFLPRLTLFQDGTADKVLHAMAGIVSEETNQNLTPLSKLWLQWHFKLGHLGFKHVRWLAENGALGPSAASIKGAVETILKCSACQFGKQHKRPTGSKRVTKVPEKEGALKRDKLAPGELVFMDQLESRVPGRRIHTAGRERNYEKFCGSTVFCDAASHFIAVEHQVNLTAAETLKAKAVFERIGKDCGVEIQSYHADNGIFKAKEFTAELLSQGQDIKYSGVGAKHQNGQAENAIKIVVSKARTMMIHAALHWPEMSDDTLWPLAVSYAADLYNHTPNIVSGMSPAEIFYRAKSNHSFLKNSHPWGCPVYVLEPRLQDNHKIPKWQPRSRQGQFMGFSPDHAQTVGMIRNLRTGFISPQFHCVYDDWFETVTAPVDEEPPQWQDMLIYQRFQAEFEPGVPPPILSEDWMSPQELHEHKQSKTQQLQGRPTYQQSHKLDASEDLKFKSPPRTPSSQSKPSFPEIPDFGDSQSEPQPTTPVPEGSARPRSASPREQAPLWSASPREQPVHLPSPRELMTADPAPALRQQASPPARPSTAVRPGRPSKPAEADPSRGFDKYWEPAHPRCERKPVQLYDPSAHVLRRGKASFASAIAFALLSSTCQTPIHLPQPFAYHTALQTDPYSGLVDDLHPSILQYPSALKAKKKYDADNPSLRQALSGPHAKEFRKAMDKEIQDLERLETWEVVPRSELKAGSKVIPGLWVQRIKRKPDGSFLKFKSRFCVQGQLMEKGVHYDTSYSPVVGWPTIRASLLMAASLGWHTRILDYQNAFVQAEQRTPLFIELPPLYKVEGREHEDLVLRVKKALYGTATAPRMFYLHLKEGLEKLNFVPSESDPCLFINKEKSCMILTYIDDQVALAKDPAVIDEVLNDLKEMGHILTVEDGTDFFDYLGIHVTQHDDMIEMTQHGLINKVLNYTGLAEATPKDTPAALEPVGTDPNGKPFQEDWNYAAAVGMLLYLSSNTRPDIQFAVHSAARFTHNPKHSHAQAVKRICRYLKGTKDKGILFKPNLSAGLDMFVDADFCGLYNSEDHQDPVSVKSRTGYVLTLFGCPLLWASKLQSEITLSTVAAEYVAFSMGMRELLPMRALLKEIGSAMDLDIVANNSLVRSTVFDDSTGCLSLVNVPKMSPRNKYLALKYHFFRENIGEDKGIVAKYVNTKEQLADGFTKSLPTETFRIIRKLLMGW